MTVSPWVLSATSVRSGWSVMLVTFAASSTTSSTTRKRGVDWPDQQRLGRHDLGGRFADASIARDRRAAQHPGRQVIGQRDLDGCTSAGVGHNVGFPEGRIGEVFAQFDARRSGSSAIRRLVLRTPS